MRLNILLWLCVAAVAGTIVATAVAAPRQAVDVKATLIGEVLADGLTKPDDNVSEGDPLVYVQTRTGRGVAARAPADGRVLEVLVQPGSLIREPGTVVARMEPR
jgi:biotin carboxyl carrier protein